MNNATDESGHSVGRVSGADRWWDIVALLFVVTGGALFLFARRSLNALAQGTYAVPKGVSYVARADIHLNQTHVAVALIAVGVVVGSYAAVRHRFAR